MAEQVRDIAEQEPEQIRQQIDDTRSAITEKLEALEEQVADTVQNVKETVQETIETTRDTVQETVSAIKQTVEDTVSTVKDTFDLRLQVERHPWPMLGGALAAGVLTGALIGERRQRQSKPLGRLHSHGEPMTRSGEGEMYPANLQNGAAPRQPSLFDRFHDEIAQVKGLALGMVLGMVRDVIKDNLPQMAEQVGEVMDRFTTKLGGAPVKGPVLQRMEERKAY